MMMSPLLRRKPMLQDAGLPHRTWFDNAMSIKPLRRNSAIIARMPSVEPSSMTMISSILRVCSRRERRHFSIASASLWPATTTLSFRVSRYIWSCRLAPPTAEETVHKERKTRHGVSRNLQQNHKPEHREPDAPVNLVRHCHKGGMERHYT